MRALLISILGLVLAIDGNSQTIRISKIANDGVYISYKKQGILIDGLFTKAYEQFEAPSEEMVEAIMSGKGDYKNLDFVLATHKHADHYNKELIQEVFEKREVTVFLPAQVKQEANLSASLGKDHSTDFYPTEEHFIPSTVGFGKIKITTFRIPHAGNSPEMENQCYLIEFDNGKRILHTGDGDVNSLTKDEMSWISDQSIDLAILPFFEVGKNADMLKEWEVMKSILPVHFSLKVPDIPGKLKSLEIGKLQFFEGEPIEL